MVFMGQDITNPSKKGHHAVQRNTSELYQDVHSLKGSAANLGANRLVNLCGELEARCRSGPLEVAPALLAAIHQELAKVRADLLDYREHPSKAPSIPN